MVGSVGLFPEYLVKIKKNVNVPLEMVSSHCGVDNDNYHTLHSTKKHQKPRCTKKNQHVFYHSCAEQPFVYPPKSKLLHFFRTYFICQLLFYVLELQIFEQPEAECLRPFYDRPDSTLTQPFVRQQYFY